MEAWKEAFNSLEIPEWVKPQPGIYCVGDEVAINNFCNGNLLSRSPTKCTIVYRGGTLRLEHGDNCHFGVRHIRTSNRRKITQEEIFASLADCFTYTITKTRSK